ncbi:MAG: NFACT RNA binding domain-containing protein [Candidatus Kapabacteria bacterium]|nr:NFACT RNA binding domain-containing protein [Candidatus Kapabacteria bacterium]
MVRHIYTLEKLIPELNSLVGFQLSECFSQDKDSCVMCYDNGNRLDYLYISVEANNSYCYLISDFHRQKRNSADVFNLLIGETLQNVELIKHDRIIRFTFINSILYIRLYGGSQSAIIACSTDGKIIDSLNLEGGISGVKNLRIDIFECLEAKLTNFSEMPEDLLLSKALKNSEYLLGVYYTQELLLRLKFEDCPINKLESQQIVQIESEAEKIHSECLNSREYYLLKSNSGVLILSLIPLINYPDCYYKSDNLSDLIRRKHSISHSVKSFSQRKNSIIQQINRKIKRISATIFHTKQIRETASKADYYRLCGDLLCSQPDPGVKSIESVNLDDYEGNNIIIKLNPRLNLIENSKFYYDKSKKSRAESEIRTAKLPELENNLNKLLTLKMKIEETQTMKQLDELKKGSSESNSDTDFEKIDPSSKYRVFELSDGFFLYVGKSAANNDELTMKFAKQNDIWLHARGSSGSHAVIRVDKGKSPTKAIIREAADIVAYYSGARNAKYVPVAYCERKYVRKPKGAAVGAVVMSREDVVMAEPKLKGA